MRRFERQASPGSWLVATARGRPQRGPLLVDPFLRVRGGEVPHQGGNVATEKTGDAYTVNDASVVCGNLQTRNATVYLIDTVLMPTT